MTSSPGATDRCVGGFTLMELLTVLVIIGILGGLSAGVFQIARAQRGLEASAARLGNLLRAARNTALSTGLAVEVLLEPAAGRVSAQALETVGEWSFEEVEGDVVFAAPNDSAKLAGGAALCAGRVGGGVRLGGGAHVDCGASPRFDLQGGLVAEAWVRFEGQLAEPLAAEGRGALARGGKRAGSASRPRAAAAVIEKGAAFFLGVAGDGAVEAAVGEHRIRSAREAIHPDRWAHLALRFAPGVLKLEIDGLEAAAERVEGTAEAAPAIVPLDSAPLTLGSAKGGSFGGAVDEVRLRGLAEPLVLELPPSHVLVGWRRAVRFDRRGHLDTRFHDRPLRVAIFEQPAERNLSPGATTTTLRFESSFERWRKEGGRELEDLHEDEELERLEARLAGKRRVEVTVDLLGTVR